MKSRDNKLKERKARARKIQRELQKLFPGKRTMLLYGNPWELLIAVILSAQCTDRRVNAVTEKLFRKYKKLDDYVRANLHEFERDINSVGFYRNKARNILNAAKIVKDDFGGAIPKTMEEILIIPGIGRKTANVVLGNAYGISEGIAVDTHVKRFARKFDLTENNNSDKIERDLMSIFPKDAWLSLNYRLIEYGRNICPARRHNCSDHPLTKIYPRSADIWPRAK